MARRPPCLRRPPKLRSLRDHVDPELRDELQALHRRFDELAAALGSRRSPHAGEFCEALVASFGPHWFFSIDLVEWIAASPRTRAPLRHAMRALCRKDSDPNAVQLGLALKRLVPAPPPGFRVEYRNVRGTSEWRIEALAGLTPTTPAR